MESIESLTHQAERQNGLITRAGAAAAGLSTKQIGRRLADRTFVRIHQDVYRLAGVPTSERQTLLAACLAGSGGVASHRSAGSLWGLSRVVASGPEILVAGTAIGRLRGVHVHRTDNIDAVDVCEIDGIPATALPRTLLDLGAVLPPHRVESALEDAVLRLGLAMPEMRACLDRLAARGRNGCGVLRALLDARDPDMAPPEGELEIRLLRLLRQQDLPEPVRQHRLQPPGRAAVIVDFAYPDIRLAIEADSRRWHAGRQDVQRNSEKRNALTLLDWSLLSFTWFDVTQRQERVLGDILRFLSRTAR